MDEVLKTYVEWLPIFEAENNMKVIDNDGARNLQYEGRLDELLTKQEAFRYFICCTMIGKNVI
jgi:hypothetical protein